MQALQWFFHCCQQNSHKCPCRPTVYSMINTCVYFGEVFHSQFWMQHRLTPYTVLSTWVKSVSFSNAKRVASTVVHSGCPLNLSKIRNDIGSTKTITKHLCCVEQRKSDKCALNLNFLILMSQFTCGSGKTFYALEWFHFIALYRTAVG